MNTPLSSKAVTLPGWMECSEKDERGEQLTALERFILDNEPAGIGEEIAFLAGLAAVIKEERESGARETEARRLTNAECDEAIKALETYEWTGLTRDDIRLLHGTIENARSPVKSEAPQSDKCEHGLPRRFCTAVHEGDPP